LLDDTSDVQAAGPHHVEEIPTRRRRLPHARALKANVGRGGARNTLEDVQNPMQKAHGVKQ
jgi:hypothetical protein